MASMPDTTGNGPTLRRTVLDNGLTVLVREVHTAPLVSVWCWYRVGSKDEGPGRTGASHFVEHLNFKGSTNIPRDQVKVSSSASAARGTGTPGWIRPRISKPPPATPSIAAVHRSRAHGQLPLRSG